MALIQVRNSVLELDDDLLSSTGASLIGVEDSGGNYTGTTVEAALAELGTLNALSAAERAILDGATITTSEINYLSGLVEPLTTTFADIEADKANIFSGALVTSIVSQTIPYATNTVLSMETETYDVGGYHEGVTNPSRITIPTTGKYKLKGSVFISFPAFVLTSPYGYVRLSIRKNGTTTVYSGQEWIFRDSIGITVPVESPVIEVTAGDYFELVVYQTVLTSGPTGVTSNNVAGYDGTYFSVERVW